MKTPHPSTAQVLPLREDRHDDAVGVVIRWLEDRHRKAWHNASVSLMQLLQPDDMPDSPGLEADVIQMLEINVCEWLLARGDMFVKGEMRPINAHLLGRDGPYLMPSQQRWIAQLAERPLRLYRVTDVRVGEGMTLMDELDAAAEPLVVRERSGSQTARPGMLMGARVMHVADHLELSGAIYGFSALREADVVGRVRAALDAGLHSANNLQLAELTIAQRWLAQWIEPLSVPDLRDATTGEPILLVTDHYRVNDPAALARGLLAQPDVSGDPEQGWHRNSDAGGGMQRSLAAINPGKSADRIEIFYRTQHLANEGRAWLEAVAGRAVGHLTREVTDPRSTSARKDATRRSGTAPKLEPEAMTALLEQVMRKQYANWVDEPIPMLGHQTPREAVATSAGLERVKALLRSYESDEARMAGGDGRPPMSYQFLWDVLGISHEG
jgi:hypothetical protein